MTVFVHIGAQKTGSTSIQKVLYENRLALLKSGVLYPEVLRDDFNKASHYNSVRGFSSSDLGEKRNTQAFMDKVNSEKEKHVLISAENLSNWPHTQAQAVGMYWSKKLDALTKNEKLHPLRGCTDNHLCT